jgi:hypothetical protein
MYADLGIISIKANMLVTIGIMTPIKINIACFEKNPEFFIEYLIKINNEMANNKIV